MKKLSWVLYVFYVTICLIIGQFRFERLKKRMSEEEIEKYTVEYVQRWSKKIMQRIGVKVNVVGLENLPEENFLFVSNHQEHFDTLIILGYISKPTGFVAKRELEKVPGLSYWMKQIHCVFMDREDTRESMKSILEGIDNLKKGYTMCICPEGTRSRGPELGEFKKGSMKLATKAGVPIVPLTLNNVYKITDGKSVFNVKPVDIDVIISKPISTKALTREEQNNLSEAVKSIIKENLDDYKAS